MNAKQKIWKITRPVLRPVGVTIIIALSYLLRIFPIQKNKVVVSVYDGRRYDDNQKFIIEELHRLCPKAVIVWVKDPQYHYELPDWIRPVKWRSWQLLYDYTTARIWTNNCGQRDCFAKRKGQLYIETWHGVLGIKKVAMDVIGEAAKICVNRRFLKGASMADVFISNSDHLSNIYRRAFKYKGPIWKCGYPKNDMLVKNSPEEGMQTRRELGIPKENHIMLYAPTWRLRFEEKQHIDMDVYDIDMQRLKQALTEKFGGEWTMLIRFHPTNLRLYAKGYQEAHPEVMDVTDFQDMQRLLMATDVLVSDYSSCIFDAALRRIPCFTYATDFELYKYEEQGVYYDMDELPFPYAKNNDELEQNVKSFDMEDYLEKWDAFTERMGLVETGHAAKDIAEKMADFLNGKKVEWQNDYPITIPKEI